LLRGETAALLLCVALVGSGALFSTELLFEMTCCDPRYPAMENLKSEKFYFIEDSWDYGFFKKMSNLVATIPVADAPRYPGATLLYVDVSVKPVNPFQDVSSVSLVQLVKVRQLLPFWKDRYYLHDYKYFSPTVLIFRVAN
jgi:hypothetical protein